MAHTEKLSPRKFCILVSKRTKSCSVNTSLVTYQMSFTRSKWDKQTNFMCNVNYPKFPCRICAKNVHGRDKAVQCHLCEFWINIKCNNLNYLDYRYLQNCDESWHCIECCSTIFPLNSLSSSKTVLACCTSTDSDSNFMQLKELGNDHKGSLLLKPSPNLELLVKQFNNATQEDNNPEKISSS